MSEALIGLRWLYTKANAFLAVLQSQIGKKITRSPNQLEVIRQN